MNRPPDKHPITVAANPVTKPADLHSYHPQPSLSVISQHHWVIYRDGVLEDCPRPRWRLEYKKSWLWSRTDLTCLGLDLEYHWPWPWPWCIGLYPSHSPVISVLSVDLCLDIEVKLLLPWTCSFIRHWPWPRRPLALYVLSSSSYLVIFTTQHKKAKAHHIVPRRILGWVELLW